MYKDTQLQANRQEKKRLFIYKANLSGIERCELSIYSVGSNLSPLERGQGVCEICLFAG